MGNKFNLLYNFEALADQMNSEYKKVTAQINHMLSRGEIRESILKDVIKKLLPTKYEIGSGIITDARGAESNQQDIYIFDAFNSPVFLKYDLDSIVPVESVYATIEVKSCLSKEQLQESIKNIRSVKRLEKRLFKTGFVDYKQSNYIMGCVFAYTSKTSLETAAQNLFEYCKGIPRKEQPSVVCILDKGLIVNIRKDGSNQIDVIPSVDTMLGVIENSREINLYLFYLILLQFLNSTINYPPDLLKYAATAHALDNVKIQTNIAWMPEGAYFGIGNEKLSKEESKFFTRYHEAMFKIMAGTITEEEFEALGNEERRTHILKRYSEIFRKMVNGILQNSTLPDEIEGDTEMSTL